MRNSFKTGIAGSLAALVMGLSLVASPADAKPWPKNYWGPAVGIGIAGLAVGAMVAASENDCIRYRPVYDRWGNFLGRRAINVCE